MILAYLGGRLGREESGALAAHAAECEVCGKMLAEQQAVFDVLDDWSPEPISAGFDERLRERIEGEKTAPGWWRNLLRPVMPLSVNPALVGAAACLVVVAGILMKPVAEVQPETVASSDGLSVEQIERATEDLEMLLLLGPAIEEAPEPEEDSGQEGAGAASIKLGERQCV